MDRSTTRLPSPPASSGWFALARILVLLILLVEVERDTLTAEVTRVVQETLQPEQVSVWLKIQARASK